ncbi:MAG: glycosyltransferase family 39 protein [Acidobacteria bacterium]|nr:glycosyltransferase family 39 protein [Acidobacteriota bacterium]
MRSRRLALILLIAAAILPYVLNLGATSIIDANEAFYTETPREMIEAGDYVNPTFNYEPRLNKPPLSYWAVAASYRIFGVSLTAARVPIAAGALVILAAAFVLGRLACSTSAGLVAALTLAATPRFLLFSRRIIIDVYTAMFLGLTLLFFVLAESQPQRRRRWLLAMYVATGLGVITKGPIAIALPALVFLVYLITSRRLMTITRMMLPTGVAVVSLIVVPYYALLYSQHGWDAIATFLMRENLARYAEGVGAPSRGPLFYLPVLFADLYFPWSLLLPAGFALVPWRRLWRARSDHPGDGGVTLPIGQETVRLLLGLWIVVIVAFFSLSKAQQDLYILPCVVAAAALVGGVLDGMFRKGLSPRLTAVTTWSVGLIGIVLLALGCAIVWVAGGAGARIHVEGATATGVVLAIASVVALVALARRSATAACAAIGAAVIVGHWMLVLWALPDFERYKPVAHLARAIQQVAAPGSRIGTYLVATPSVVFYLQRHVDQMFDVPTVSEFFAGGSPAYCLMTQEEYERIKPLLRAPTFVLASSPRFDAQLRDIITTAPLPNLVVVASGDVR